MVVRLFKLNFYLIQIYDVILPIVITNVLNNINLTSAEFAVFFSFTGNFINDL